MLLAVQDKPRLGQLWASAGACAPIWIEGITLAKALLLQTLRLEPVRKTEQTAPAESDKLFFHATGRMVFIADEGFDDLYRFFWLILGKAREEFIGMHRFHT